MLRKIKKEKSQMEPFKETTNKTAYFLLIYNQGLILQAVATVKDLQLNEPDIPWLKQYSIKGLKDKL